jgi:hypothetical protein
MPKQNHEGNRIMHTPILFRVERFLRATDIPPTRFGRMVAKDPRLVLDMRNGREIGTNLCCKIEHFMNKYQERTGK